MTQDRDRDVTTSRREFVLETLRVIHPPPCRVQFEPMNLPAHAYAVLPNANVPRLAVPLGNRRVVGRALRSFKTSTTPRERARNALVAAGIAWGGAALIRDRVYVDVPERVDPSIDAALSARLGTRVSCAMYIGPERAIEKPVAQLIDDLGRLRGFAKFGVGRKTTRLVRRETENLAHLSALSPRHITVPDVLYAGTLDSTTILVQQALRPAKRCIVERRSLLRAVAEIYSSGQVQHSPLAQSEFAAELSARIAGVDPEWRGMLQHALKAVSHACGDVDIAFGGWHGDFAPWNMTPDGNTSDRLAIWDWEHYERSVPLGFDLIHYALAQNLVDKAVGAPEAIDTTASQVRDDLADLHRSLNLSAPGAQVSEATFVLYLIEIACRYLEDGENKAGTRAGKIQDWLPIVLPERLHIVTGS